MLRGDKVDYKGQGITREEEAKCVVLKGSIHKEDIIINLYSHNDTGSK